MILIAGCGYVGGALAGMLADEATPVTGLRRDTSSLPPGVRRFSADVLRPGTLAGLDATPTALVYAVSPSGRSAPAYRDAYVTGLANVVRALGGAGGFEGRLVFVSSTGAYGHSDGAWVDEETPPAPTSETGRVLVDAERRAIDLSACTVVLRLGGIYGPGRTRTIHRVLSGEAECPPAGRYGNRIHRDDAARAVRHLLKLADPCPLYLGVDRNPAELREVQSWIGDHAGVPDPCAAPEPVSPETSPRRRPNKRCSSDRLVASGFEFRYPTYKEGYAALMGDRGGPDVGR